MIMRAVKLEDLTTKSKIFVPKGRWLLGTVDETKTLEVIYSAITKNTI